MAQHPQREPADRPPLPKAPGGDPAARQREEDTTVPAATTETAPTGPAQGEELVNYGGRIPASLRRRARMYVAAHEIEHQDFLAAAVREYLDRHDA